MTEQTFQSPIRSLVVAALAVAMALGVCTASAQSQKSQPQKNVTPFGGIEVKRGQPVKIQATSLEVRDKEKKATFRGDVHVVQGETDLRCHTLVVYYDNESGASKASASKAGAPRVKEASAKDPSAKRDQQIRKMIATGNVIIVTQKGQRARGDRGDFDMHSNTVVLTGNVVVASGDDVLRGQRLVVDLTTGVSRMESGGGRVEGLFQSKGGQNPVRSQRPAKAQREP
ncbi:MAG: LptA/OstA family protein [Xanthobacteraceae bacterium]